MTWGVLKEPREPFDQHTAQRIAPVMGRILGDGPPPAMETEEFEVRGLVLPRGGIAQ